MGRSSMDLCNLSWKQLRQLRAYVLWLLSCFSFTLLLTLPAFLDMPELTVVVNMSLPYCLHKFITRVGRVARAGRRGVALSFYDESRDHNLKGYLVGLLQTNGSPPLPSLAPYPATLWSSFS